MKILDSAEKVRFYATTAGAESIGGKVGMPYVQRLAETALALLDQRNTAFVERDEAHKQRDSARDERTEAWLERDDLRAKLDALSGGTHTGVLLEVSTVLGGSIGESVTQTAERVMVALAEARRDRDELGREGDTAHALLNDSIGSRVTPRKGETALVSQARTAAEVIADLRLQVRAIEDARAILGAAPDELLSDVAKRTARAVESVYPGPQVLREILGAAEGQGVIPAARAVVAEADRLRKQVGEVQRLAGVCETMGAKAIGDARRSERVAVTVEHVRDVSVAMDRRKTWNAADPAASWAELLADLRVALAGRSADELAQIRHALSVPLDERACSRWCGLRTRLPNSASDLTHHSSMRYEVARAAGLPDATAATWVDVVAKVTTLAAEAETPQVFRIQHEIAIAGDLVTIRVAPLRDPAIRALPLGVQLGLVVCDE